MTNRIKSALPALLTALCVLQPCLDVLSYWVNATGTTNEWTSLLRLAMLALLAAGGFVLSPRKKDYCLLAGVLLVLTVGHVLACAQSGYDDPWKDLANMLRIYQLPILTVAFVTLFRQEPNCVKAVGKGFALCILLIAGVELISVVTGTNPYSYPNKSVGILGWFYFANSQSAVLSMLVPIAIAWTMERFGKKPWAVLCVTAVGFAVLYGLATRLAYAALVGVGVGLTVSVLLVRKLKSTTCRGAALILALCTVVCLAGYTVSPMSENARLVAQNRVLKMEDIQRRIQRDEAAALAAGLSGTQLKEARLQSAYEEYLPGVTGRFGISRTAELYEYSENVDVIADMRLQRLNFCKLLLEDSPAAAFWFGLEREDISQDGVTYDVENDFHGIFYLCGAVGLALMLAFFAVFLLRIVLALVRDFRGVFTLEAAGYGLALICGLAHAYFTAGVLRRPNVTMYLALLLAAIWELTRKKQEGGV